MLEDKTTHIIDFIQEQGECSSTEIFEGIPPIMSYATLKRTITKLVRENILQTSGKGKSTKYFISPAYELIYPVDVENYFKQEIDERKIKKTFNFNLLEKTLLNCSILSVSELSKLNELQQQYLKNISQLSENEYKNELERLAIDLSWKSSQIEGNSYSLLETERLLKEKETASGKTKEEAVMLINHKEAIDFIVDHPHYVKPLSVSKIEDIHSMLVKELNIDRNLRKRRVGISGTNYRPLDNEFQIIEVMKAACKIINKKENVFEKALLTLVLISYIQPFMDGNKRTARIVSNAILMNENYCPLSFRTVDSIDYKKAMLLFYEQNNISNFKDIFIAQFEFAVNTYF